MKTGVWWATVHGVVKSETPLSNFTFSDPSLPTPPHPSPEGQSGPLSGAWVAPPFLQWEWHGLGAGGGWGEWPWPGL